MSICRYQQNFRFVKFISQAVTLTTLERTLNVSLAYYFNANANLNLLVLFTKSIYI